MTTMLSNNRGFSMYGGTAASGARTVTAHLADPVRVAPDAATTGNLSAAAVQAGVPARGRTRRGASDAAAGRRARANAARGSRAAHSTGTGSGLFSSLAGKMARTSKPSSFVRYASDSRAVQAIYAFTTGPQRFIFYLLVLAAILVSLYFPVRDLYVANRAGYILTQQLEIRKKYKDDLQAEVDSYLSKSGIEDAARKLGMVMPGEQPITVTGDGQSDSSSTDSETTSADVERALQAVYDDVPWYYQILDQVFFFNSADSQAVSSAGTASSSTGK